MVLCDSYDKLILGYLDKNSRQSFSQIGKEIDLPKSVVSYRVKKLMKKGIIKKFYTVIDTYKLGYSSFRVYIAYQYTTPEIEKEICEHFKKSSLNWWTVSTKGRFDLAIIMWANDIKEFYIFWEDTLKKYRDYFREQEFSIYLQSHEFLHEYLNTPPMKENHIRKTFSLSGAPMVRSFDHLDLLILKEISNNARISFQELSKNLRQSSSKIKQRFNQLIADEIILGFRVDIDIEKIGYKCFKADILLKDYTERNEIIEYVVSNPHLIRIDKSIGISDLELEFHVANDEEFQEIMSDLNNNFKYSIRNFKYLSTSEMHNFNLFPLNN